MKKHLVVGKEDWNTYNNGWQKHRKAMTWKRKMFDKESSTTGTIGIHRSTDQHLLGFEVLKPTGVPYQYSGIALLEVIYKLVCP
jgi:hypothetical protein